MHSIRVFRLTAVTTVITVLVVLVIVASCLIEVVLPFYINRQLLGYSDPALKVVPLRRINLYIKGISHTAREPLAETADPGGTVPVANVGEIGIFYKKVGERGKLVLLQQATEPIFRVRY